MSLYREPGRLRRRRRALVAGGLAALVAVGAVVALVASGSDGETTRAERAAHVRAAADRAANGLDLLLIEYGQAVRAGRVVAPTEYAAAKADVARAREALVDVRDDIRILGPAAGASAERALSAVAAAVSRREDRTELARLVAAARASLAALRALR